MLHDSLAVPPEFMLTRWLTVGLLYVLRMGQVPERPN